MEKFHSLAHISFLALKNNLLKIHLCAEHAFNYFFWEKGFTIVFIFCKIVVSLGQVVEMGGIWFI